MSVNASSPYAATIHHVRAHLLATRAQHEPWFDLPQPCLSYRPRDEGWTIAEILEHVTLTSTYLLLVIEKSVRTCLKRAAQQLISPGESDLTRMEAVGHPDAFPWLRPEHMEPTRAATMAEVRQRFEQQLARCLALLEALSAGEGSLHLVRMSVQELGKLDVYQWLYFLSLHARRHGVEIERVIQEWHDVSR